MLTENLLEAVLKLKKFQYSREYVCPHCHQLAVAVHGADLAQLRKHLGISLREMARRGGLSAAYLCDVEHNRRACTERVEQLYVREICKEAGR